MVFCESIPEPGTQPRGSNLSSTSAVASRLKVWWFAGLPHEPKQNVENTPWNEHFDPENRPKRPKKETSLVWTHHPFSGAKMLVSGRGCSIAHKYAITHPTATLETSVLYTKQGNDQFRCNWFSPTGTPQKTTKSQPTAKQKTTFRNIFESQKIVRIATICAASPILRRRSLCVPLLWYSRSWTGSKVPVQKFGKLLKKTR